MEFFELNQICEWCAERSLLRGSGFDVVLPDSQAQHRQAYAHGRRSGEENAAARQLTVGLGAWDECLVWVRAWGIWPSGEDWPKYYAWRGAVGERRALDVAPGHLFKFAEMGPLVELVTLVMENAWDTVVLCSRHGHADGLRAEISHDEWFQFRGPPS